MNIRKSKISDMYDILNIFDTARVYMSENGNPTQWEKGYPGEDVLKSDIMNEDSYVIITNGLIVGTFSFIIGEEPSYHVIKNGAWHYEKPYGTIHRLASNGTTKGIAKICFKFCSNLTDYIRIDTHMNNQSMQAAIEKFGFQRCGNIYVRNGSERIAYDYMKIK